MEVIRDQGTNLERSTAAPISLQRSTHIPLQRSTVFETASSQSVRRRTSLLYEDVGPECDGKPFTDLCDELHRVCHQSKIKLFVIMIAVYNEQLDEFQKSLFSILNSFHISYTSIVTTNNHSDYAKEVACTIPLIMPIFDGSVKMHSTVKEWLSRYFEDLLTNMEGASASGTVDVKSDLQFFQQERKKRTISVLSSSEFGLASQAQAGDDLSTLSSASASTTSSLPRPKVAAWDNNFVRFGMMPIVKRQNHRKHNSHYWCFAQCAQLDRDVGMLLLTDCGTLYHHQGIPRLWRALVENPKLVGVTGRLRVEQPDDEFLPCQECKGYCWRFVHNNILFGECLWCWLTYYLTPCAVQSFECEATFATSTAVYNLVEAIPVLPGPGQCFRWKYLKGLPIQGYKTLLTSEMPADDASTISWYEFILTQTRLAEDRILSFVAVFMTGKNTKYVHGATFVYQPMVFWQDLLTQRRRWINGGFGSFLFNIATRESREIVAEGAGDRDDDCLTHQANVLFLWCLQVMQLVFVLLAPALFSGAIYLATADIADRLDLYYRFCVGKLCFRSGDSLTVLFLIIYAIWTLYSYGVFKGKVPEVICGLLVLVSCFYSLIIYSSILLNIHDRGIELFSCIFLIALTAPVAISLRYSRRSALKLLMFAPPYLLCIMFQTVFIPAYSFARLHDTTWGNRDTGMDTSVTEARLVTIQKWVFWFNVCLVTVNCVLAYGLCSIPTDNEDAVVAFISIVSVVFLVQLFFCVVYIFIEMIRWVLKKSYSGIKRIDSKSHSTRTQSNVDQAVEPARNPLHVPLNNTVGDEDLVEFADQESPEVTPVVVPANVVVQHDSDDNYVGCFFM